MSKLYDFTAEQASKLLTESYSTSFTMGIKTLHKSLQQPVFNIYGFVRVADEIVDTFHNHNQRELLDEFKVQTYQAIERGISTNAILHSFQKTVNEYNIPHELIEQFLHSMYMDLDDQAYDQALYEEYIRGSAEVVGLMCLCVFCEGDMDEYNHLKPSAERLGSVFQKVNFLRDLNHDYSVLGRTYFPEVNFETISDEDLQHIYDDIEADFDQAKIGILKLNDKAKLGVYLAYKYYRTLFEKIKSTPKEVILKERIRIPDSQKYAILAKAMFQAKTNQLG